MQSLLTYVFSMIQIQKDVKTGTSLLIIMA